MKKIILYLMLLLSAFVGNGCVAVYYPDDYYTWPEERRVEWCHQHPHGWFGHYRESPRHEERREEHREHHDRH